VRLALVVVLPLSAALLQISLAPALALGGARPNVPVLFAASWALAAGAREGAWWAFAGGLLADLFSRGPLGAWAFAALPPVTALGMGERPTSREVPLLAAASLVGVATFAFGVLYAAVLALLGQPLPAFGVVAFETAGGALYSAVLALGAYPLLRAVRRATASHAL
jgi:rod shape-determining protein MreD